MKLFAIYFVAHGGNELVALVYGTCEDMAIDKFCDGSPIDSTEFHNGQMEIKEAPTPY